MCCNFFTTIYVDMDKNEIKTLEKAMNKWHNARGIWYFKIMIFRITSIFYTHDIVKDCCMCHQKKHASNFFTTN